MFGALAELKSMTFCAYCRVCAVMRKFSAGAPCWLMICSIKCMRRYLPFLIIAGLGILYLWQKSNEPAPVPSEHASGVTPAQPRQVSEHDWAKHSIDRAREVAEQARKRTQDAQNP